MLGVVSWGVWIFSGLTNIYKKSATAIATIYMALADDTTWFINSAGQFANANSFNALQNTDMWKFDGNLHGNGGGIMKKFPLLSCEFTCGAAAFSMDNFIEEVRYSGELPPLAVIMAAYSIYSKQLYAWPGAKFVAFTRSGSQINFDGSALKLPDEVNL
jgi:hypothetical protein